VNKTHSILNIGRGMSAAQITAGIGLTGSKSQRATFSKRKNGGDMKLQYRSEKGLLTPDNCVITLIDHQPQMLFGVTSIDRQSLINNVVGFAKAARIFEVPLILSTVETKSFSGNLWPQLQAIYPDQKPIELRSMN
jgi:hypothetical protein